MKSAFEMPADNPKKDEGFPYGAVVGLVILGGIAAVVYWKWDDINVALGIKPKTVLEEKKALEAVKSGAKTTVTLTVIDDTQTTPTPLAGATVEIEGIGSGVTDNSGVVTFNNVPVLPKETYGYNLKITDAQGGNFLSNRSMVIQVKNADPVIQTITKTGKSLEPKQLPYNVTTTQANITLTAVDPNKAPIKDVTLRLRRAIDDEEIGKAVTDANGVATFLSVPHVESELNFDYYVDAYSADGKGMNGFIEPKITIASSTPQSITVPTYPKEQWA